MILGSRPAGESSRFGLDSFWCEMTPPMGRPLLELTGLPSFPSGLVLDGLFSTALCLPWAVGSATTVRLVPELAW